MRGGIRKKRPGYYELTVYLGRDPVTQRPRYRSYGFKGTRREAEARLRDLLGELPRPGGKMTLGEYVQAWLLQIQGTKAPKTVRHYAWALAKFLPEFGSRPLAALQPVDFLGSFERLGANLAPGSRRDLYHALHACLQDAEEQGLIRENPLRKIQAPRPARREMRCWTPQEVQRFLAVLEEGQERCFFCLLLYTGLRMGEALGLRWSDWQGGQLAVNWTDRGPVKTPGSRRRIPVSEALARELRKWKLACPPGERMFYWTRDQARWRFLRAVQRAGVTLIRPHDLRHTFATTALAAGVPVKVVSQILGHSSVQITLQTYAHVLPGMGEEAVEVVADAYRTDIGHRRSQTQA